MNIRKVLLFLFAILCLTGCQVTNISTDNYINNINTIIKRDKKYTNKNAIGYQYFVPNGVTVTEVNDYNQTLLSNGDIYYLYADVVSYYHLVVNKYTKNEDAYISEKLETDGKYGYLEVNKVKDKYYIEMMFNYAKIESIVSKTHLKDALNNIAYILSSVKYNTDIIENLLGDEKYNLSESETYNIFKTKKTTNDNFLKYDDEYGKYESDDAVDLIEKKEIEQNKDN